MKQVKNNFLSGHPIIAQLLSMVPKEIFNEMVEKEGSDRYYKKLMSVDHFITMFYAVLTRNGSLREVCKNISLIGVKLIPFGLKQLPARRVPCRMQTENVIPTCLHSSTPGFICIIRQVWDATGSISAERWIRGRWRSLTPPPSLCFKEILRGAGRNPSEGDKKGGVKVFAKIILHRVGVLSGKHKKTPY